MYAEACVVCLKPKVLVGEVRFFINVTYMYSNYTILGSAMGDPASISGPMGLDTIDDISNNQKKPQKWSQIGEINIKLPI